MNYRYPPEADATDVFDVTDSQIDQILDVEESDGRAEAIEFAVEECDMSVKRAEDLLEWFGR